MHEIIKNIKIVAVIIKWLKLVCRYYSYEVLYDGRIYEACPESKDTNVLNMYNIFNLQVDTVNELPVHNFIFQHSRRHCPNIY